VGLRTTFSGKPQVSRLIAINWFNSCMIVYFPVWHSHCTRDRFTMLVSRSDALAVQRQVAKPASGLFHRWSLLRNNNMATNNETMTAGSGKARCILCERKHGWILAHLPRVWKIHRANNVPEWRAWPNYAYSGSFSHSKKLSGLFEYVYPGCWDYV